MKLLKLYDNPRSIHAQYARVVLDESGAEYKKELVELPLGNLHPSYARVSPVLSVPALELVPKEGANNNESKVILTDSRDIIKYCAGLEGSGKRLFPEEKRVEIDEVLDMIYSANGGQISFQSQQARDPLFRFVLSHVIGPYRTKLVRRYVTDPEVTNSLHLKKVYEAFGERSARQGPSLEDLSLRANKVMSFLHGKLEKGPWLLGQDHTAADCVAAIWVQWIVWADDPSMHRHASRVELPSSGQTKTCLGRDCANVGDPLRENSALCCGSIGGMCSCRDD